MTFLGELLSTWTNVSEGDPSAPSDLRRLARGWTGSSRARPGGAKPHWLDTFSAAMVGSATTVSVMFYALDALTSKRGGMTEGSKSARPEWLSASVHQGNSIFAWTDLLLASLVRVAYPEEGPSPFARTFGRESNSLLFYISLCYLFFCPLCKAVNGKFPYPFLNRPDWPRAFAMTAVAFFIMTRVRKRADCCMEAKGSA